MFVDFLLTCSLFAMIGAFIWLIFFMLFKDYKENQKSTDDLSKSNDLNEAESVFNANFVSSLSNVDIKYSGVINTNGQKI